MKKHIISVWVENEKGVLSRVAGLFSLKGYNIESLAVGSSEQHHVSRMTIVAYGDDQTVNAIISELNTMANVRKIRDLTDTEALHRELALIMVDVQEGKRSEIISIAEIFRAQIVDVGTLTMTIEVSGSSDKIQAMEELLKPFGIREIVRTGIISIERGNRN